MHAFPAESAPGTTMGVAPAESLTRSLVSAAALCFLQVTNVVVLDENPAGLEGPWVTYARMVTLRTNKALTGEQACPQIMMII